MNSQLINYWTNKINALITHKGVEVANLVDPDWANSLDALLRWTEINHHAIGICRDVYANETQNHSAFPAIADEDFPRELVNDAPAGIRTDDGRTYMQLFWDSFFHHENNTFLLADLVNTLDYTPSNDDTNNEPHWENLARLLNDADGNDRTLQQVLDSETEAIRDYDDLLDEARIPLGLAPDVNLPAHWETLLVKKTDLDTATATITTLTTDKATLTTERDNYKVKSDEYDRIKTKLSGKISDVELDALLSNQPSCSHTDYNSIKKERDTLKTERDTLTTEKTDTNKKINTELGLAENSTLDQILAKIKELNKTPDAPDTAAKDTEITNLKAQITTKEQEITNLKAANKENISKDTVIKETKTSLDKLGITLSSEQTQELQSASLERVEEMRNELTSNKFTELKDKAKSAFALNIGLGILTLGSLGTIAYLIIKRTNLPKIEPGSEE